MQAHWFDYAIIMQSFVVSCLHKTLRFLLRTATVDSAYTCGLEKIASSISVKVFHSSASQSTFNSLSEIHLNQINYVWPK